MKKHKAKELFNNKCLPTLSTLGCIITPLHGFQRNMCGIEELASYLAFVEHQTVDDLVSQCIEIIIYKKYL